MLQNISRLRKLIALIVTVVIIEMELQHIFMDVSHKTVVSPNQKQVINLEPEFIKRHSGTSKTVLVKMRLLKDG